MKCGGCSTSKTQKVTKHDKGNGVGWMLKTRQTVRGAEEE